MLRVYLPLLKELHLATIMKIDRILTVTFKNTQLRIRDNCKNESFYTSVFSQLIILVFSRFSDFCFLSHFRCKQKHTCCVEYLIFYVNK